MTCTTICSVWLFREKQISIHILLNLQLSYNRSLTLTNATYMYVNFGMLNFHHAVVGVQQLMLYWFISRVLWKHLSGESCLQEEQDKKEKVPQTKRSLGEHN